MKRVTTVTLKSSLTAFWRRFKSPSKAVRPNQLAQTLINIAVVFTILLGAENILFSYNHRNKIFSYIESHYAFFNSDILSLHRTISVIIGFVLIFTSYRLYKRMRMAWVISICMLAASIFLHIFKLHNILNPINIIELIVILILSINHKEFKRASDPLSLRNGILMGLLVLFVIILNMCFSIYILNLRFLNFNELLIGVKRTLKMMLYMDSSILGHVKKIPIVFIKSSIAINWIGMISAIVFILNPLIYQPLVTLLDREKVKNLVKLYGDNPNSYITIEDDKKYYFGRNVEGVIAYAIAAGVAVCAGDPICSDDNMPLLLAEFITYCKQNDFDICICQTLERHIPLYAQLGFGNTKYGIEAMFELEIYNLTGGKAAKVRNAVNHANALGITVSEYKPIENKDKFIEYQINDVSNEWLQNKKGNELTFMIGTISLDDPLERRYFVAHDSSNNMLGFIVFSPFSGGMGYLADITRRRSKAPIGVMEKIVIFAFDKMKSEGLKWGSLGLAPLVNSGDDGGIAGKALEFVYEKFNGLYGFKALYHYKKKYGPTSWESRYIVYYPKLFTPKIAYSIVKAQNPKGVGDYLLIQLKSIFAVKKEMPGS